MVISEILTSDEVVDYINDHKLYTSDEVVVCIEGLVKTLEALELVVNREQIT